MNDYIQRLRLKLGQDSFIHPAARIIIENDDGQILFIRRQDNGLLGLPAGSMEANESIEECIRREVREETGLRLLQLEVIGISSHPEREGVVYPNGDAIQYFTIEFYSNQWEGSISIQDAVEVTTACFLDPIHCQQLPPNEQSTFESWQYFQRHQRIFLR
ncbi:MAG: NUDIX domain-containing protein [Bacteroidota bacterium]